MSSSAARYFPVALGKGVKPNPTDTGDAEAALTGAETTLAAADEATVPLSDEVLIARICEGEKEAFGCLFRRYARLVRAIGYKILRDESEADDLLQDVFLFVHRKSEVFDSSKSPARSWIVQVTYHRAIDRRRYLDSRHFYTRVDLEDVARGMGDPASEDSIDETIGQVGVRKLFQILSENQYSRGLVCLTGGEEGPLAAAFQHGRNGGRPATKLKSWSASSDQRNVYVELQRHFERNEEYRNRAALEIAESLNLPDSRDQRRLLRETRTARHRRCIHLFAPQAPPR